MLKEYEKIEIMKFTQNAQMVGAVRKVFDETIAKSELSKCASPVALSSLDDNKIGQIVRAQREAVGMINSSFDRMFELSAVKKPSGVITNPAR